MEKEIFKFFYISFTYVEHQRKRKKEKGQDFDWTGLLSFTLINSLFNYPSAPQHTPKKK